MRKAITPETTRWQPEHDVEPPVRGTDVPGFRHWVNWNGYQTNHQGHDFAAYVHTDGHCVLGLPEGTPVRAIADGEVLPTRTVSGPYFKSIRIQHTTPSAFPGSGMLSAYTHVVPTVNPGERVRKGQVIGTLYKSPGSEKGTLVHLHFSLYHAHEDWKVDRNANPTLVFPDVAQHPAKPQGAPEFEIPSLGPIQVQTAHFKKLDLGWMR